MDGKAQKVMPVHTTDKDDLVQRIGQLVRMLRENMRQLGLNKQLEEVTQAIPDARDRLDYVARMTEQAAERSLNAIDRAQPLQKQLAKEAEVLSDRWDDWFESPHEMDDARDLVKLTRGYLTNVPTVTEQINRQLLEITMAQDFQDLTGQVIKKMIVVIQEIESGLLQVLLENVAGGNERDDVLRRLSRTEAAKNDGTATHGPQVHTDAEGVLSSQGQVDDLLDELGF